MNETKTLYACEIPSPLGAVVLVVNENGSVRQLGFGAENGDAQAEAQTAARTGETVVWDDRSSGPCAPAARVITAFLRGDAEGSDIFNLPRDMNGTPFQQKVWAELCRIPPGETITYGELSRRVTGDTKASRAVGRANATNPVALVVPCHRVIGANGALTGYAYGIDRKTALLALERGTNSKAAAAKSAKTAALDL